MLLNNIFSCALADSARLNLVFMSNISIVLILFFGQVDQLQNELEREKKRSRDERQNSEHRIKELQTQVEKLKLGRVLTQQAVDEEKCLGSEVPSREEAQKRKCTDGNVGSVKKVRFAVEDDSHVQEMDAAPLSERRRLYSYLLLGETIC